MKNLKSILALSMLLAILMLSSCSVVGDIFQAGMDVGIFIVVALVIVVLVIMNRLGKK